MIKLLYITNAINGAGGLERVLAVKTDWLIEKYGYDITILTLNGNYDDPFYELSKKIKMQTITVNGNPIRYISSYVSGIKRVVNQVKPDVISVCDDGLKGFFIPIILKKRYPIVYERHVSKEIEVHANISLLKKAFVKLKWLIMERLAANFSKFVVLTKSNLKEWPSLKNAVVISNPLPFSPQEASSLMNRKVIAVGKHSYQKGFDRLLQAWKIVQQNHSDWQLDIYGKFDESKTLPQLAENLKIERTVFFHQPEKDIQYKYLESSIYVMSSRYEGFGMVLIEAMICGLPCVSFNCNYGPADIIDDNVNGYLVKNGDIEELAKQIIHLIEQEEMRKNMGVKAREKATHYKPETILKEWDILFKGLGNENSL